MICWKCGHLNEETSQFCEECGANIWHADMTPNRQPQNENQQNINQQHVMQQNKNQTQSESGHYLPPSVEIETKKNSSIKIVALVFAVLYLIKSIMYIPVFFSEIGRIFSDRNIFISIIGLAFSILWMLSFVLLVGSLVLLAMHRTKTNGKYLYLAVVLAEALHVAVAVLNMIWDMILLIAVYRVKMPTKVFLSELLIVLFAFAVLALLFALFSREGEKSPLGKTKDELKQMVKDLPTVLQTEFETFSTQSSKSKENNYQEQVSFNKSSYSKQSSFNGNSYSGQVSFQPGSAGGPLKTNRGLFLFVVLTVLTCGIYGWYFYYSVAKDANIICEGDGEETAGLLQHILLSIVTCGVYEYIWQCQLADRLQKNASRYGVNIEENGTTVILWFIPGSCCCGIGCFVAYHIQIKNLNKMARAYNEKMFTRNRTNV